MTKRRVVVTGLGVICPLGLQVSDAWQEACSGRSGVGPITRFDAGTFPTRIAAEVKNFDPARYLEQKEIKKHDLFSQYSIAASDEAWKHARLSDGGSTFYSPERMGCILGVGIGGISTLERYHQAFLEGGIRKISPFLVPAMISNLGPGNVAMRYGLKNINYAVTSACTSSTHAIGESFRMISHGYADLILTGGAESAVTPIGIGGFCAMKALSTRNEEPQRASRPFDKERDGFVLGEGAAVLVLEALESAEARGAPILCEVAGYGVSCDAYHLTAPSPDGLGAAQCMRGALQEAGISPEQVQYVNAHGTSTPANDATESSAIKQVFGPWAKGGLAVSSTKSMTGHLLGAAGAIEAMFCALAIRDGIVPPTINYENKDEDCDLDYVPHEARRMAVRYAVSNSFGFGGTNASIVLKSL